MIIECISNHGTKKIQIDILDNNNLIYQSIRLGRYDIQFNIMFCIDKNLINLNNIMDILKYGSNNKHNIFMNNEFDYINLKLLNNIESNL